MGKGNEKLINRFGAQFEKIKNKRILGILEATAFSLSNKTSVPFITYNLWDSIGCGVYHNGTLMKVAYPPSKKAEVPRTDIYGIGVADREYWGREELEDMIENPPLEIKSYQGWCLYYVAAMPYAEIQDKRSDVDVLREELVKPIFKSHIQKLNL